jgi:hypothetical protein
MRQFGALGVLLYAFAVAGTGQAAARGWQPSEVLTLNKHLLNVIAQNRSAPTVAARAIAIVNTCMYDAWAHFDDIAMPSSVGIGERAVVRERTLTNKKAAVATAGHLCLEWLYPNQGTAYQPAQSAGSLGDYVGRRVAGFVIEQRAKDGADQEGKLSGARYGDYTAYFPSNTPQHVHNIDKWQPLRVPTDQGGLAVQNFTTPHWRRVTGFALVTPSQFRPQKPPLSIATQAAAFKDQVKEVVMLSAHLSDIDKASVEYWVDGTGTATPPGHWCEFAEAVAFRKQYTLDEEMKLFFLIGNAMLDASIAAWDAKWAFDSVRPITAVRTLYDGATIQAWGGPYAGTVTMQASDWMPYQPVKAMTPPFPEYVSGHSVFSAAAAEVLKQFTGTDQFEHAVVIKAGSSRIEPGHTPRKDVVLSWRSFSEAADDAGYSRRLGGLHFKDGDTEGRNMGRAVGLQVWLKAKKLFEGPVENSRRAVLN